MKSVKKRSCKSEENWSEFQIWNLGIEKELDELKLEKKEVKYQLKLAKNCMYERLDTAIGVIDEDEPIIGSGYLDVPEFEKGRALDEGIGSDICETEYIETADVPIERIPEEMGLKSQIEAIPDDSAVPVVESFTSIESADFGLSEVVSVKDDFDLKTDTRATMPGTYAEAPILLLH